MAARDIAEARHLLAELADVEGALGRVVAGSYGECIDCGEAIAAAQKFVELSGESVLSLSLLGSAYGFADMKDEALKILERLDGLPKDRYVGSLYKGIVSMGLGEKDEALENLEKAFSERESAMAFLKAWPLLDSLRTEPRFQALLKKMNLE
jgi:tetratricopeptide (TPR) repeat protein